MPNAPTAAAPVLQTVPSSLSMIVKAAPDSTLGLATAFGFITFIMLSAISPVTVSVAITVATPLFLAVTSPFWSTVNMSVFELSKVKFVAFFFSSFKFVPS